jgi:uncharacterized membrane protein
VFTTSLAWKMGLIAGSRSLVAPMAVSWAASPGWLDIRDERLKVLAQPRTTQILAVLALGGIIGNKLPATPSRTSPIPFAARVVSGALSGFVIGTVRGQGVSGVIAGVSGAVIGTLLLGLARGRLAQTTGRDWPVAMLEDALAVGGALSLAQATTKTSLYEWIQAFPVLRVLAADRQIVPARNLSELG